MDQGLMALTGIPQTCGQAAPDVCENRLGISVCPSTCGYCAPMTYKRYHKFKAAQISILPTIIHQSRKRAQNCDRFSDFYDHQGYNIDLDFMPALDGQRAGPVLLCVDEGTPMADDFAFRLECPA